MIQIRLAVIVFLSGAAVMMLELCGSRLLAPLIGSSFYVWTSLIGSVLAALSIGYWKGGQLADRSPSHENLSLILLVAAGAIGIVALVSPPILIEVSRFKLDPRLSALLAASLLFGPPCIALGMVQPYALRLCVPSVESAGRSVGLLTACSTLGSLSGTFLLGFFLFAYAGTMKTLLGIAFVLALCSILAHPLFRLPAKIFLLFGLYAASILSVEFTKAMEDQGMFDFDTAYQRILVFPYTAPDTGKRLKVLSTGVEGSQSVMDVDHPDELITEYLKAFHWALALTPKAERLLLVGGGGYSLPKNFRKLPGKHLDVVELDPGITEVAKKHFNFTEDGSVTIRHEDARTFFRHFSPGAATPRYDVIFLDAYNSAGSIPFHLTTREFMESVSGALAEDGILVMNVIAAIQAPKNCMLRHLYWSVKKNFPDVAAYRASPAIAPPELQNVMVVGRRGKSANFTPEAPNADFESLTKLILNEEIPPPPVEFTDDFAPAEYAVRFGC